MTATFHENEYGFKTKMTPDPTTRKTPAAAAKALHKALTKIATDIGITHDENMPKLVRPDTGFSMSPGNWGVVWEGGPYEWAIPTSLTVSNDHWHTEPYYSFDLYFYAD